MVATLNLQFYYRCYQCKAAADIYGRHCKYGFLFPVLLMMTGEKKCPNYEFDMEKIEEKDNQIRL